MELSITMDECFLCVSRLVFGTCMYAAVLPIGHRELIILINNGSTNKEQNIVIILLCLTCAFVLLLLLVSLLSAHLASAAHILFYQ